MNPFNCYYENRIYREPNSQQECFALNSIHTSPQTLTQTMYYLNCMVIETPSSELPIFKLGIDQPPPGYQIFDRLADAMFLHFVISGRGRLNGELFFAGDCFYTRPYQLHTIYASSDTPFHICWLMISGSYMNDVLNILESRKSGNSLKFEQPDMVEAITKFHLYQCRCSNNAQDYIKGIVTQMLSYIQSDQAQTPTDPKISKQKLETVNKAKAIIHQQFATITVEELANQVFLERKYFTKIFREVMGISPGDYILNQKLMQARNLLTKTDLPINKIKSQIGYAHRNSLDMIFEKRYGLSPAAYRHKYKK